MKTYKHLFFDLDGTLWDFAKNSEATLHDIYINHGLQNSHNNGFDLFFETYNQINHGLWEQYRQGTLEKEKLSVLRFSLTLEAFGIVSPGLAEQISVEYITQSPRKTLLLPHAIEILQTLRKNYHLHIITNGFIEVQLNKISNSGIQDYIGHMITSEEAGCLKPCNAIFEYAFHKTGATPEVSLMIGDDYSIDIEGASMAGMDTVFFNPLGNESGIRANYEIKSLSELTGILKT
jgi:putative hydrolase of the HAD superfamily